MSNEEKFRVALFVCVCFSQIIFIYFFIGSRFYFSLLFVERQKEGQRTSPQRFQNESRETQVSPTFASLTKFLPCYTALMEANLPWKVRVVFDRCHFIWKTSLSVWRELDEDHAGELRLYAAIWTMSVIDYALFLSLSPYNIIYICIHIYVWLYIYVYIYICSLQQMAGTYRGF